MLPQKQVLGFPLQIEEALLVSLPHAHTGPERINRTHGCIADVTEVVMSIATLVPTGPHRATTQATYRRRSCSSST